MSHSQNIQLKMTKKVLKEKNKIAKDEKVRIIQSQRLQNIDQLKKNGYCSFFLKK